MSAIPVIVILSCLFILGSSRPRVAVRVVAVQGFFLGLLPLLRASKDLSAGILILGLSGMAVKGLLLPLLMSAVLRRTGIQRESDPPVGYGASLVIGVLLLGLAAWLAVSIGFPPRTSLPLNVTAFFLIMVGLFLLIGRRLAIMRPARSTCFLRPMARCASSVSMTAGATLSPARSLNRPDSGSSLPRCVAFPNGRRISPRSRSAMKSLLAGW